MNKLILTSFLLISLFLNSVAAQTPTWTLEWDYLDTVMTDIPTFTQVVTIDNSVIQGAINCAVKAGVQNAVTCRIPIPVLPDGIHTISVSNTKNGMTATTTVTGLDTNLSPANASSPRINITVNVSIGTGK